MVGDISQFARLAAVDYDRVRQADQIYNFAAF